MHLLAALLVLLTPQQQRVEALERQLIAPCCWSESVHDHQSPVASEMRSEIAGFVEAGRTDAEILDYYRQKYGRRVLIEPGGDAAVVALFVPLAAILAGAVFMVYVIRRMRARAPVAG